MAHVARVGAHTRGQAARARSRVTPCIREVRGAGLMWGLDLDRPAAPVVEAALAAGAAGESDGGHRRPAAAALRHHGRRDRRGDRTAGRRADRGIRGTTAMTMVTFRQATAADARGRSPADRRQSRGRPPAAAHARRRRRARAAASSSPSANGSVIALRRAGAAEQRRSPKSARWSSTQHARGNQHRPAAGDRAGVGGARRAASRRSARSRTSRRTSSSWASRSCRTCGCRRRSRTTARRARCSGAAGSTRSRCRCAPASRSGPSSRRPYLRRATVAAPAPECRAAAARSGARVCRATTRGARVSDARAIGRRRHHRPDGVSAPPASPAASRPRGLDLALIVVRHAGVGGRRCSRPIARRRRRSSSRAATWRRRGARAAIVVNSGCANACTGRDGHARTPRRWPR